MRQKEVTWEEVIGELGKIAHPDISVNPFTLDSLMEKACDICNTLELEISKPKYGKKHRDLEYPIKAITATELYDFMIEDLPGFAARLPYVQSYGLTDKIENAIKKIMNNWLYASLEEMESLYANCHGLLALTMKLNHINTIEEEKLEPALEEVECP